MGNCEWIHFMHKLSMAECFPVKSKWWWSEMCLMKWNVFDEVKSKASLEVSCGRHRKGVHCTKSLYGSKWQVMTQWGDRPQTQVLWEPVYSATLVKVKLNYRHASCIQSPQSCVGRQVYSCTPRPTSIELLELLA